jgi:hypothetical protein
MSDDASSIKDGMLAAVNPAQVGREGRETDVLNHVRQQQHSVLRLLLVLCTADTDTELPHVHSQALGAVLQPRPHFTLASRAMYTNVTTDSLPF